MVSLVTSREVKRDCDVPASISKKAHGIYGELDSLVWANKNNNVNFAVRTHWLFVRS
jgi:hypothetical protein